MFAQEQLVVYPTQGVGKIEKIERQNVGGQDARFYIIRIMTNNITVMVPVANASSVGLRTLCSTEEASSVLDSFSDRTNFSGYTGQNWNRRYREYTERLKSSSLFDVAHVLKELFLISGEKELSFGERRLLEQAMGLITSELSCVLRQEPDSLKQQIEGFFEDLTEKQEKAE